MVPFDSKSPVLVFRFEGLVLVAAFSDEVGEGTFAERVELDPSLDGD